MIEDKKRGDELNEDGSDGNETGGFLVDPAGDQDSNRRKQRNRYDQYREMFDGGLHSLR